MLRREPLKFAFYALLALATLDLLLLVSGYRVLVAEERGEEWTDYSKFTETQKIGDTLSCTYFTGRSFRTIKAGVYDSKPDECPFFFKPQYS